MKLDETVNEQETHQKYGWETKITAWFALKMETINFFQLFIVLDMKNNIISVGQLLENNYDIHIKNK